MNKTILVLMLVFLTALLSCKTIEKETSLETETGTKLIKEYEQKIEKNEEQVPEEKHLPFEETPKTKCALFTKEEGNKICGLPLQASKKTEYSCQQVFSQDRLPYQKLSIKILEYSSKQEAGKKFLIDQGSFNGKISEANTFVFEARSGSKHYFEVVKGAKIIRITELPEGSCKDINRLIKFVIARA